MGPFGRISYMFVGAGGQHHGVSKLPNPLVGEMKRGVWEGWRHRPEQPAEMTQVL